MKIGIIGSGEMGVCLATRLVKVGHKVSITNARGPASLQSLSREIGVTPSTTEEILGDSETIIVAIQQMNIPNLPRQLFQRLGHEVVVIDTGNYYPVLRDGTIPELEQNGIDSLWVQQQLSRPVVKAFNAILATSLQTLGKVKGDRERIAIPASGDHLQSNQIVFNLIDELGFDSYDTGTIADSWKQQPGSPIYCRDLPLEEVRKRAEVLDANKKAAHNTILANRKRDESLMARDYSAYLKTLV